MIELQKQLSHNQLLLMYILRMLGMDDKKIIRLNKKINKQIEKAYKNIKEVQNEKN